MKLNNELISQVTVESARGILTMGDIVMTNRRKRPAAAASSSSSTAGPSSASSSSSTVAASEGTLVCFLQRKAGLEVVARDTVNSQRTVLREFTVSNTQWINYIHFL